MVQTATPTATVSNDWTVTGSGTAHEALASASDSSLIETVTQADACRVNIGSLTDPVSSVGHIIKFRAQATGSGAPERVQVKIFEGTTERAASGNIAITRGSFNAFSYTLDSTETDAISDYTDLRIEVIAAILGSETLEVSEAFFEIPDAGGTAFEVTATTILTESDAVALVKGFNRTVADAQTESDAVSLAGSTYNRAPTTVLVHSESIASLTERFVTAAQTLTHSEAIAALTERFVTATTVLVHSSINPVNKEALRVVAQAITHSEAITKLSAYMRTPNVISLVGLIAYLKMNNDVLDTFSDNDGTVTGTNQYTTGQVPPTTNGAFDFNGSSYITLDGDTEANFDFEHTQPFSIALWVRPVTGANNQDCIIAKSNDVSTAPVGGVGYGLIWINSGRANFRIVDSADVKYTLSVGTGLVPINTWTHIVCTFDGNSNLSGMHAFVNGVNTANGGDVAITNTILNNVEMTIGAESDGSRPIAGQVDDVSIWDRALTSAEITDLYNSGTGAELDPLSALVHSESIVVVKGAGAFEVTAATILTHIDSIVALTERFVAATTVLVHSEVIAKAKGLAVIATTILTHSESIAALTERFRTATTVLTHSEAIAILREYMRTATTVLTHSEGIIVEKGGVGSFERTASQNLTHSDSNTILREYMRTAAQNLIHFESIIILREYLRTATTVLTHSESIAKLTERFVTAAQTLTHSSVITQLSTLSRAVAQLLTHADSVVIEGPAGAPPAAGRRPERSAIRPLLEQAPETFAERFTAFLQVNLYKTELITTRITNSIHLTLHQRESLTTQIAKPERWLVKDHNKFKLILTLKKKETFIARFSYKLQSSIYYKHLRLEAKQASDMAKMLKVLGIHVEHIKLLESEKKIQEETNIKLKKALADMESSTMSAEDVLALFSTE